jgi:hypothetical protein
MKQDVNVKTHAKAPATESLTTSIKSKTQKESLEDILRDIEEEMIKNPRALLIF